MHHTQGFQSEHKGGCGSMGRGKFNGPWGRGTFGGFGRRHGGWGTQPPVNIEETDTDFVISLFAAGLQKDKVTLSVKDDVLTVSYPDVHAPETPESASQGNYTYQEYSQKAFERQFRLNGKVLTESISASYADGILKVTLPRNPATNKPAQSISVA